MPQVDNSLLLQPTAPGRQQPRAPGRQQPTDPGRQQPRAQGRQALQNMKFLKFFLFLWVIFAILASVSGYTDLVESGFETLLLMRSHNLLLKFYLVFFLGQLPGCSPQQETKRFNSFL